MTGGGGVGWVALVVATVFLLWVDLHFFARGREPSFREGVYWSIGWLVISMLAGVSLLFLDAHGTEDFDGPRWFTRVDGHRQATPIFVCLAAIVAADIAFAIDSIPAAFAITRDSVLIWMGNVFALLGLRALFVLVEGLIRRFRYLDETIAIVLGIVAVKLLAEDLYKVGPVLTLVIVFVAFAIGILASVIADRRDPDAEAKREERTESLASSIWRISSSRSPRSTVGGR